MAALSGLAVAPPFPVPLVRLAAAVLSSCVAEHTQWRQRLLALSEQECFQLDALVRYWHVAPALWLQIRGDDQLLRPVRDTIRTLYWQNIQANGRYQRAIAEVTALLNGIGIEPILLKGAAQLCDPPTGHAGTRYMHDLDLLVPEGREQACQELLIQAGFEASGYLFEPGFHHLQKLVRPADQLMVEVHRFPWMHGDARAARCVIKAALPITVGAGRARLPSLMHRLLIHALHPFADEPFRSLAYWHLYHPQVAIAAVDLKQVLDFAEFIAHRATSIHWPGLLAEAERFGRRADLQQWAYLCRALMAAPVPDSIARWNVSRAETRWHPLKPRRAVKLALLRFGQLERVQRWRYGASG